jgi:hypothetical protein
MGPAGPGGPEWPAGPVGPRPPPEKPLLLGFEAKCDVEAASRLDEENEAVNADEDGDEPWALPVPPELPEEPFPDDA